LSYFFLLQRLVIDGVVPPRQMLEHPSHTSFSFSHIVRSRDLKEF
jgi:hypothetical protein